MRRWSQISSFGTLIVAVVWAAVRVFPVMQTAPGSDWEIWEAHKLLEYGFLQRRGAVLYSFFMTGHLAHPWSFNYTNHPFLLIWVFTFLQYVSGPWASMALVLLVNFGASWLVFRLLQEDFDFETALIATLVYVTAPECVFFSVNSSLVAFGAWFWPAAAAFIRRLRRTPTPSWFEISGLGLLVFVAGQITWFAFTLVPVLLLLSADDTGSWRQFLQHNLHNRLWWAILAGACLSFFLFTTQVALYTPDFGELWKYAFGQAGMGSLESPRWRMLASLPLKASVLLGPALLLGMAAAAVIWWKRRDAPIVVRGTALYLAVFAVAAALLLRFAFRERSLYAYLLFPSTYLCAWALQGIRSRLWRWCLLLAACASVAYVEVKTSIPMRSETAQKLGRVVAAQTQPEDLILSNLIEMHPPFPRWDIAGVGVTRETADRLIFFDTHTQEDMAELLRRFHGEPPPVVYLRTETEPIEPSLDEILKTRGQVVARLEFQPPTEPESWAETLRAYYWKLQGKPWVRQAAADAAPGQAMTLEIIRVSM